MRYEMNYDLDTKQGMVNAIIWTKRLIESLNDGGTWMIPRSGTLVRVDKKTQTATIDAPFMRDPSITKVLTAMGWKIVMK